MTNISEEQKDLLHESVRELAAFLNGHITAAENPAELLSVLNTILPLLLKFKGDIRVEHPVGALYILKAELELVTKSTFLDEYDRIVKERLAMKGGVRNE